MWKHGAVAPARRNTPNDAVLRTGAIEKETNHTLPSGAFRRRPCRSALERFFYQVFHRHVLKRQIRVHAFEPGVLRFELAHPFWIRGLHVAVSRFPVVLGRIRNTVLATQLRNLHSGIGFFDDRNNLFFGGS